MKVKKKPAPIEAVRFERMGRDPDNVNPIPRFGEDMPQWLYEATSAGRITPAGLFSDYINVLSHRHGGMLAAPGDYIVFEDGDILVVAGSLFERSYEVVP